MRKSKNVFAAIVVGVAVPGLAHAADLRLDYTSVQYSTTPNFTPATTINLPLYGGNAVRFAFEPGAYIRFGLQATVTNNPNSPGNFARGIENNVAQPPQLGVSTFETAITNSNVAFLAPQAISGNDPTMSTAVISTRFSSVSGRGVINATTGDVGTGARVNRIFGGVLASNRDPLDPTQLPALRIGTSGNPTDDNLFRNLTYQFGGGSSAVLTPAFDTSAFQFVTPGDPTEPGFTPSYFNRLFNPATDTFTGPGPLTIGVPEPASLAIVGIGAAALLARRRTVRTTTGCG